MSYIKSRSFTLIELIVVVIIAGVLAAMMIPGYNKYIEEGRGSHARNNLMSIYNAEKRFKLDNGYTYPCTLALTPSCQPGHKVPVGYASCTIGAINDWLYLDITDPYFSYTIIDATVVGSIGYIADAVRNSDPGPCAGKKIRLRYQAGARSMSTDCPLWAGKDIVFSDPVP